jgi:hypothetical protein
MLNEEKKAKKLKMVSSIIKLLLIGLFIFILIVLTGLI